MPLTYEPKIRGIRCNNCRSVLYMQTGRIKLLRDLKYCPLCGQEGMVCNSLDEAFWWEMSYTYGLPIETLKPIYQEWVSKTPASVKFGVFFKEYVLGVLKNAET